MQVLQHCHEFQSRQSNMCMRVDRFERREFGKPELVMVLRSEHPAEQMPETRPARQRRLSRILGYSGRNQQNI